MLNILRKLKEYKMDIKTSEQRSRNMAAIRSKNTRPEIYLRKLLFSKGYRYRINSKKILGHPDIYLKKYNTAVFIHGCFWHRHENCKFAYVPKTRVDFWQSKFAANQKRDLVVKNELLKQDIKCLVIWECSIKEMKRKEVIYIEYLDKIEQFFRNEELYCEL